MPALHPIQRPHFLRRRYVRRIILLLLIVCARVHAQNIEGQIVASQFGQFQVPGTGNESLQFSPASCQVSGGGKNFSAFEAGVPIKIVDTNPALTEIDTPTTVFLSACSVAMTTTYPHSIPFYLTSGTGGLQEALSNGIEAGGGPTTVILNADWYTQVKPANPATVLASVKGSTSLGLVDVTTTPYTYYQWNGSNYAAVANGGGSANFPGTPGIVYNTSVSAAQNATSTQIATQLNISPTTTLARALLPTASNSSPGLVQGDGTTTSVNGSGVISANQPTGTGNQIVATPNGSSGAAGLRVLVPADLPVATSSAPGAVKPDNSTITISGGVITSIAGGASTPNTNVPICGNGAANSTRACSAGNDFITPSLSNGMNPPGPATTGTNQNSNSFWWQGSVCTLSSPCTPQSFYFSQEAFAGSGVSPTNTLSFQYSGPGSGKANFVYPVNLPSGPMDAKYLGAYGDAYAPQDGCQANNTSTTIYCPDAPFVSTDVGKQIWVHGAGAAGVAFNATINTVTDSQHVVVSATPSTTVTNTVANTVYGHDDSTAVQACFTYSAVNAVPCVLTISINLPGPGQTGFLIGSSGLQLVSNNTTFEVSATHFYGSSQIGGPNLFCEYNGDCLSIAAGPIEGAKVSDIELLGDPSQPSGRGIHLHAAAGSYGTGGLWNSNFDNVSVTNFAQECLLSEGGPYNSSGLLPIQIDTFTQFYCNAPNQMHTANLIKMTGQHAQITFINGQVNGPGNTKSNQPNAMILITEQTTGHGDSATDIKFIGYTYEIGTIGLQLGSGAYNIHYDNSYVEGVNSPVVAGGAAGVYGFTYNGNHIANSGDGTAVAQFTGNVTGSFHDSLIYGSSPASAAIAVCTGTGNSIDFSNNYTSPTPTTPFSNCATTTAAPSSSTLTVTGGTSVSVAADATPITTISAPVINAGKTLTLYASGTFSLATGGNINLGGFSSPMTVTAGDTVTLTLLDQTATWTVTGTTPSSSGAVRGTTALATSSISSGACQTVTAGSVNSSAATGATTASKIIWTPATSLQTVTGYKASTSGALSIDAYPTAGYVNFNVCNGTASSITPGALTLNWELQQ
jgi:hypothetical protein